MKPLGNMLISYTLPIGLSLWGATPTPLCSLFIFGRPGMGFGDAFLTALMSATMAAAFFYYTGFQLLREFGLPADTTMVEFHKFMRSR
ncbi:hypothetical protein CQ12_14880 [Bradyrhizobium jicamae]|uniref:Uncharacterized protein n=2 Tax=Bradyrhizobium jicamae TaxID=280332 RepID=A0A0R3L1X1_9BRAD|nr:hypothetical protein CQ12_14880 [Bradyrhizobium jicamae]